MGGSDGEVAVSGPAQAVTGHRQGLVSSCECPGFWEAWEKILSCGIRLCSSEAGSCAWCSVLRSGGGGFGRKHAGFIHTSLTRVVDNCWISLLVSRPLLEGRLVTYQRFELLDLITVADSNKAQQDLYEHCNPNSTWTLQLQSQWSLAVLGQHFLHLRSAVRRDFQVAAGTVM